MRHSTLLLLVALGVGLFAGAARADRLDQELNRQMPAIVKALTEANYRNVGVLPFRVQQPGQKEGFEPPLGVQLARRVENLLVIHAGPGSEPVVGVIHAAGQEAARRKVAAWYDQAERGRLFDHRYRLAWGRERVEPDAFITGKVALSAGWRQTTLTLEYFDRRRPEVLRPLGKPITVATDRFILRDLGRSFSVSSRAVTTNGTPDVETEDKIILEDLPETGPGGTAAADVPRPDNVAGVRVEMVVDDKTWSIREAGAAADGVAWQTESPPIESRIALRLKNTTPKRLAVVVRLNGVNTIDEQTAEPENCRKWVLEPGKVYLLRGFYLVGAERSEGTKETQLLPFRVLVDEEARKMKAELGPRAALIEIDVFDEGPARTEERFVSTRGLPPSGEKDARRSYRTLKRALLKSAGLRATLTGTREIIVPAEPAGTIAGGPVKVVDFANARLRGRLAIKVVPAGPSPREES
jgi:hypothetical protein